MFRKLVLHSLYSLALAGMFASLSAGLAACAGQSDLTPIFTPAPTKTVPPTFTPTLDFLHMDRIPGLDPLTFAGQGEATTGEKYSLPQDVFSEARSRHLAPIEAEGSIAAACDQASCTVMLTDVLVTGAQLQPATDGKVIYGFDGQAGSEALFRFSGLPEGVRATAFVSQEGNPWGFKAGTVVVWFWEGGGKGPTQILNQDNPLRIMADSPNQIQISSLDNGLVVTTTDANGTVIDEQRVVFLPTPEAVFVPEGFQIGELGLLQNPETGKNVLAMNPEADWERVREEIIGGLWQANVDWANFTGQGNDAVNYTKDAFIVAALKGQKFHIGIPVRLDRKYNPKDDPVFESSFGWGVVLEMVDVKFDHIQIQILDPPAFKSYTGMGWSDNSQKAYSCKGYPESSDDVCLFTVEEDNLVLSVGNFSFKNEISVNGGRQATIGRFDPALYEKRPSYFRPDGIGVEADNATTITLGAGVEQLSRYSIAHGYHIVDGNRIKLINIGRALKYPDDTAFYLNPKLFVFSKSK